MMAQKCSKHDAHHVHALLQDRLAQFQAQLAPGIDRLIAGRIGIRPWIPDPSLPDDDNLRFFKRLHLPAGSPPYQDRPSLLLHDLGCFLGDPDYEPYITQIFKPGCHTLFVNTSGAGKTRIVLEGLCQHWGFYLTAQRKGSLGPSALGSADLQNTIYTRLSKSSLFTEHLSRIENAGHAQVFEDKLTKNCEIAGRLFGVVLLSRLVVFEQYLATMHQRGFSASNELKQRWLMLQVDPSILDKGDIFNSLVDDINSHDVEDDQIRQLIAIYWCRIHSTLNTVPGSPQTGHNSHVYLVVDEAQDAVEQFPDAFRSHYTVMKDADSRPVLRALVNCWFNTIINLNAHSHMRDCVAFTFVITGTGISGDVMQEALSSSFFKAQPLFVAHITGGLDTPGAQLKYIKKYLPQKFLDSEQGRALAHRLWYWLSGRFRFTAEYIALLIQDGLRRPHILLNAYIRSFSTIIATDNISYVKNEPDFIAFPNVTYPQLQYEKLLKRQYMLTTIKELVYNYLRRSLLPHSAQTLGTDESLFVQYGFARYRVRNSVEGDRAELCEPLILLATAVWLNSKHEVLHKSLANELGNDSTSKNGFEDYIVYYFNRVFEKPTLLSEVFQFQGKDLELSRAKAKLVAVHRSEINEEIVDFSQTSFGNKLPALTSLSGCLGENAKTAERLEEWLQLKKHAAFCFPPLMMGPDILFVLELHMDSDRPRYIWVAVQAKFLQGGGNPADYVSKSELTRARKTVTPNQFYFNKNHSDHTALDENGEKLAGRRNAVVLDALDRLPHRETRLAGRHSLLRVIAAFPTEANLPDLDINDPDGSDGHPLVCLRHEDLISRLSKEHPTDKLKNVKREHIRKIKELHRSKAKATLNHDNVKRLKSLTLPSKWDRETLRKLSTTDIDDYIDCFRCLILGEARVPKKKRKTKDSQVELLHDLLQEHYGAGGPASVKSAYALRPQGSNKGRLSSSLSMDADGDVDMDD